MDLVIVWGEFKLQVRVSAFFFLLFVVYTIYADRMLSTGDFVVPDYQSEEPFVYLLGRYIYRLLFRA